MPPPSAAIGSHVTLPEGGPTPPAGQAWPAGRGLQTSVKVSLSIRRGLAVDFTFATTLHFPAFFPFFRSLTARFASVPQPGVVPEGLKESALAPHFPLTFTGTRSVAVQEPDASLAHTLTLNVQDPFAVLTPSASQLGSQSVQMMVPPFLSASGTSPKSIRHSVVASMTA